MLGLITALAGSLLLAADYRINEHLKRLFKGRTNIPRKVDYAVNISVGVTFIVSAIIIIVGVTLIVQSVA